MSSDTLDIKCMKKYDLRDRLNRIADISAYYGSLCVLSDILKNIDCAYEEFPLDKYMFCEIEERKKYALNELEKLAEEVILKENKGSKKISNSAS